MCIRAQGFGADEPLFALADAEERESRPGHRDSFQRSWLQGRPDSGQVVRVCSQSPF